MENKFTLIKLEEKASERIVAPTYSYWKSVLRRFLSSKVAIVMFVISASIILMSLIYPMFNPYSELTISMNFIIFS